MKEIHAKVKEKFPDAVFATHDFRGDETVVVRREALLEIVRFLKEDPEMDFNVLMDLSAVDNLTYPSPSPLPEGGEGEIKRSRFEVVVHLYSLAKNHRLRLKVPVEEADSTVPTLTGIWPAADWYEREVWDMFGIRFLGHPNLKRILMYEAFVGHPLRKDYPVNKRQPLIGPKN